MTTAKICPQCGTEYPPEQRFCATDGATLVSEAQDGLIGQVIADRYLIIDTIGEGGMGQVYLAEHVRMQRRCALKVMHRDMTRDADAVSRFNREASNASRIQHPNVAAVYDFGEASDGMLFIAMEFVEGASLSKVVEQHGGLSPRRAANIIKQTADALAVAHHLGIVHRDLKPDNIMLGKQIDGSDQVKLLDFGIAKSMSVSSQKVTRTGLIVGTPDYMSPEQMSGDAVDSRSDIYSLALVAVFVFTEQLPFDRVSSRSALVARLSDPPKTLAELRPDVSWPAPLQAVLTRALDTDPAARYQKVEDFARNLIDALNSAADFDLEAVSGAQTVAMRPTPRDEKPTVIAGSDADRPGARRSVTKRAAIVAGASIVALAAGLAWNASHAAPDIPSAPTTTAPQTQTPVTKGQTPGAAAPAPAPVTERTASVPKQAANRTAAIAAVSAAVKAHIIAARDDAKRERYDNAFEALSSASAQLSAEEKLSPASSELAALRRDYLAARTEVRSKCATTTDVNKGQGLPLPACK